MRFCILHRNSTWPPKMVGKCFFFFLEKWPVDCAHTLWVKNFIEISLSRTLSEINGCLHFTQKFKMVAKNGGKIIFGKSRRYTLQIPCGSKISSKSLYLAGFSGYKHFCDLKFLRKNQNGRHFWQDKFFFLKIAMATPQRLPASQKFRRNHFISHVFHDISSFVFCNFLRKI